MDIENPFIQYYINKNPDLKEYIEIYEIPRKEDIFLIEKMMSVDISNLFKDLGYHRKAELISGCNSLRYLQQCITNPDHKHFRGSFCKDRYCPICSHLKSHKANEMMFTIIQSVQKDNNYKNSSLVFLTLTQRNVGVGELKDELDKMQKAIQEMMKKELIFSTAKRYKYDKKTGKKRSYGTKGVVQGTVRHLEITAKYNPKTGRIEFHPHWHIILLVKQAYFDDAKFFWDQKKVIRIWKKYMELDYEPNVDIRKITDGADELKGTYDVKLKNMEPSGAIKEICKYSTKDSDLIKVSEDENGEFKINWNDSKIILNEMYKSLYNRRDLIFTGAFKKTKERLFGKKDADELVNEMQDTELIDIFKNKKCKTCGSDVVEYLQRYSKSNNYYYNLSQDKLESYKKGMNNEIKKIVKRKQDALKGIKKADENVTDDWIYVDDGYDPFEMKISYEEYLKQKKSDESDQQTSDS
ncbi:protein rep [Clostridium perfringens]|uniref:protein rep n=1 Tax=Clostridium perfringens TaxID=1502 RepID=UPI0039E86F1B